MRILMAAILSSAAMVLVGVAQSSSPAAPAAPQAQTSTTPTQLTQSNAGQTAKVNRIAPGSIIPVQLTKTIDAKKVKAGDEIVAQVTQDMKNSNGEIIVPKNTKVTGKVTEAQVRNKEQKESQVAISFDHAVTATGTDMSMPMSIQAVISPSYLSSQNNQAPAQGASQPSASGANGGMAPGAGRQGSTGGAPQTENPAASAGEESAANAASTHQPITGKTEGVLGIQDLSLSSASSPNQGSVLSSDKNNVKVEGGTLMLLRVNQ